MASNEARFFRFRVFFGASSLQNEVGDPQFFLPFLQTKIITFLRGKFKKICVWEHLGANVLLWAYK